MMVLRRRTGWEHLSDDPVRFFYDVLQTQLQAHHAAQLNAIADQRRDRLGLVWSGGNTGFADEAIIAVGVALWNAACRHKPTVIWGGRRSIANAWIDHSVLVLASATPAFRHDFRIARSERDTSTPQGLVMPTGEWALRYDGPMVEDSILGVQALGNQAQVMFGDFSWIDRHSVDVALLYARHHNVLVTTVVGQDDSPHH